MSEFKYRADVDGLRAVAVVLVLLFHGNLGWPGGFIGVDVFFVISGYLITGLILKEQDAGTFTFSGFWGRRVRRIIPASSVMVLASIAAGAYFLLPLDFRALGTSAVAQQLMLANVFFWFTTGYFESAAELKPLLHCWSLAVEEQFYLVYPPILILLSRLARPYLSVALSVLAVASLVISEYYVRSSPDAAFFLLPMRAWELLLGGIVYTIPRRETVSQFVLEMASYLGLAGIVVSGLYFTPEMRFPGVSALLPCVGAAMLIRANSSRITSLGRLLAARPVVGVGLISYSLYLWHWPILVFARHRFGSELPIEITLGAMALSVGVAYYSWKYVETPLRRPSTRSVDRRRVLAILCSVPFLATAAYVIRQNEGFPGRTSDSVRHYLQARNSLDFIHGVTPEQVEGGELPELGDVGAPLACLLWGDSHAMAAAPGFDAACRQIGVKGNQVTFSATAPLLDFVHRDRHGLREQALRWSEAVCDYVAQEEVDAIVLVAFWRKYADDPHFEVALTKTIERLNEQDVSVGIMLDVPQQDFHVPDTLARLEYFQTTGNVAPVSAAEYLEQNRECNSIIRKVAKGRADILDPATYLTNAKGEWMVQLDNAIIYRDRHHLTVEGSLLLRPMFQEFLEHAVDDHLLDLESQTSN